MSKLSRKRPLRRSYARLKLQQEFFSERLPVIDFGREPCR